MNKSEAILWGDNFFSDIHDLADHFDRNDMFSEFEDDEEIELEETTEEKVWRFTAEDMVEWIHSDRLPEEEDEFLGRIVRILKTNINFEEVNSKLPELCYGTGKMFKIKVSELKTMI